MPIEPPKVKRFVSPETRKKISEAQLNLSQEKRDNIVHGIRHNRYTKEYAKKLSDGKLGESNPNVKLKVAQVIEIKRLWKTTGHTTTTLGELFGVSRQSVNDIVRGRTWKHLDEENECVEQ